MRRGLLIGGAALVAVLALAGITRYHSAAPATPVAYTQAYTQPVSAAAVQPGAPVVYGAQPYGSSEVVPVARRRRVVRRTYVTRGPHVVVRKRKFSHSA